MSDEIQIPEVEIVVRHTGREIALVAYFPDDEGGYHCVVGMEDTSAVEAISSALQQTAWNLKAVVEHGKEVKPVGNVPGVEDGKGERPF